MRRTVASCSAKTTALAAPVPHVVLLSGTPSLSRPFQLWRQVEVLRPGLLGGDKWAFGRDYCARVRTAAGWFAPVGAGQRDWELHLLLRAAVLLT